MAAAADRLLGREDHVLVVREHDGLGRRKRLDRLDDVGGRRVHRLPALDDRRAEALEQPPVAAAGADGDDAAERRLRRQDPLLALGRLDVHVLHVHLLDHADRGGERERGTGLVRVQMHLDGAAAADDEQRVAQLQELRLERRPGRRVALDEERRAVAELRQLQVDRLDRDRLEQGRRLRELLAADVGGDAAHDLEQARAARVDDACLLEDVELLGRRRERHLAGGEQVGERVLDGRVARRPSPRPARRARATTVRIVPSCGFRTAA